MCQVCRCFGWTIDILQRFLTFFLACIMSSAICIGITLALGAGIAYGYNFSVAEYLDQKRSDVTVYVRRGQFGDLPEVQPNSRRSDGGNDMISSNFTTDYQDHKLIDNSKPLSETWQRAQDTRNYADKLTKYSKIKTNKFRSSPNEDDDMEALPNETPDTDLTEESPSVVRSVQLVLNRTTSSGDEQSRRNFETKDLPLYNDMSNSPAYSDADDYSFDQRIEETRCKNRKHKQRKQKKPEINIDMDDSKSILSHKIKAIPVMTQEEAEDADYYNVYKPV